MTKQSSNYAQSHARGWLHQRRSTLDCFVATREERSDAAIAMRKRARLSSLRHCEERSDEAIQRARANALQRGNTLDCFVTTRNDGEKYAGLLRRHCEEWSDAAIAMRKRARLSSLRHCEERSDEAIQQLNPKAYFNLSRQMKPRALMNIGVCSIYAQITSEATPS
ncbi:MAG: hypothetical protein LBU47_07610 [Christensenellaceae bacterium]|jgi:hypothetical protein|nr:hypothetical protein [Christensenellaceae bacterium]